MRWCQLVCVFGGWRGQLWTLAGYRFDCFRLSNPFFDLFFLVISHHLQPFLDVFLLRFFYPLWFVEFAMRGAVSYSSLKNYQKRRGTRTQARMSRRRRTTCNKDSKKNGNKMYELAKKVDRNSKYINELRIYTDYQWSDPVSGQYGITKIMGTRT